MRHQPFETWLLFDDPLTPDQARALDEHLRACETCQALGHSWRSVASLFQASPDLEPAPGFANRWKARLVQEDQGVLTARYRWQSWITLILIANGVSLLGMLLGMTFFDTFDSLTEILLVLVYRLTSLLTVINIFQNLLAILIRTIPGLLSPSGWAILALIVSSGSLLWVLSMARLARMPGRA